MVTEKNVSKNAVTVSRLQFEIKFHCFKVTQCEANCITASGIFFLVPYLKFSCMLLALLLPGCIVPFCSIHTNNANMICIPRRATPSYC